MKPNIKKLEDIDIEFVNMPISEEKSIAFSLLLKKRKPLAVKRAKRVLAAEELRNSKKIDG